MDLHVVINKATLLPSAPNAKFYRLEGLSQAEKDRKMNEKTVKTPPNLKLLESDTDDSTKESDINKINSSFDRHRILAAIRTIHGGVNLSNLDWKISWEKRIEDMKKSESKESCKSSLHKDTKVNSEDQPELKTSKHQLMEKNNKIFRNAAIMGLVKINKISLEDLADSSNKNCTKEESRLKTLDTQNDSEYQIEFVPLHEDPEVFIHPLRMGVDTKRFKDIDFTVPRVGKKIKETPQEYFIRTTNDDSFEFVKKNKNIV
ncbi:uncharacterized protein LOC116847931 isoform X1 [Odontomachus brunneus]|uniref:uncharacterized protein LOC116847931 isoform X1 n=1 Tax=Odontomachus brunneus TaxID=486640 RepID=UPI0013F18FB4|nr:uncharacterized protein LOC116847931 isoform X1 [Odontomachus brunneus]XP_032679416.1 uncharacterized protein LOC116847931 isoform X1 [Odontomachus brunneus]